MAFPVIGGTQESGYNIDNSLRFNDDDSAYLSKTFSVDPTSRQTFTFSAWIKKTTDSHSGTLMSAQTTANFRSRIYFDNDTFRIQNHASGSQEILSRITHVLRDSSAWYHLVWAIDTTQSDGNNGMKLYINGVQQSISISPYTQNATFEFARNGTATSIGRDEEGSYNHFDGYMAEVNYIDGQQLAPTEFGETDDNGVWIPKNYTGSYGTNGFKLEFKQLGTAADATSIGADTSGNNNHFSQTNVTPAVDRTEDTPTNNFATLNSLANFGGATLSEGNTKNVTPSPAGNGLVPANMGVKSGKWYWEINVSTTNFVACGIIADDRIQGQVTGLTKADSLTRVVKGDDGRKYSSNSDGGSYMAAYEGSILQVALNLDDGEITFGAGGSWANGSGLTNQTFATSTPAYTDLNSSSDFTNKFILPAIADENQGTSDTMEVNFGNPSFSISSGNSDANGYGNFEYAVPSGYYALCTKNLAQYG